MGLNRWATVLIFLTLVSEISNATTATDHADSGAVSASAITPAAPQTPDPCALAEVTSSPTRPNWDSGAATAQCGVIETDFGWLDQPMGGGMRQQMLVTSMRYGLTPKLQLRWGLINHVDQSGGGTQALEGVGDQWVNVQYRFQEQSRWVPALALNYGIKIPEANPAKGFGSGFVDHQLMLIASRDLGKNHFDFNVVGTIAGQSRGHDGAPQFGLALTRAVTPRLAWIIEAYGGPQPGVADRYGAGLSGLSYALKPWLVIDGAYVRAYTAGSPRGQTMFGLTCAMRPGFSPLPKGSSLARLLGR